MRATELRTLVRRNVGLVKMVSATTGLYLTAILPVDNSLRKLQEVLCVSIHE